MISGQQLRAARALLNISASALADYSGVDMRTIQRFEAKDGVPASRSGTLQKLKETLEARGIVFLGDAVTSPGVQLHLKDAPASKSRWKR